MKTTQTIQFIALCSFCYVHPMETTQSKKSEKTERALRDFDAFLIKEFTHEKKDIKTSEEKKYDEMIILANPPYNTKNILQEILDEMDKS